MKVLQSLRFRLEYLAILLPYRLIRLLPYRAIPPLGRLFGWGMHLVPEIRSLVRDNIHAAMPELPGKEVARIGRESLFHLAWNMFEFIWLDGNPARIERCYYLPPDITDELKNHVARGERIIFVNPHLGSWEASGVMAPYYAGVDMVAIAKPVRNPYLNRLLNRGSREKIRGLEIIFARGAIREAIKALRAGRGVGTLIDQNTKGRVGGIFVNFFGIPVSSSAAPAVLKRFCDAEGIPAVIIYGTSVRLADGRVTAHSAKLSKPFGEYADDREVIQELMDISERFVRAYPEQYLWFYRRFQNIPPDCPPEIRARYPGYAKVTNSHFFRETIHDQ